jgi:hypothetical protein
MEEVTDDGQRMTAKSRESLVFKIVNELAETSGVEITDIPPLYNYIDIEALTRLVQLPATTQQSSVNCVTFTVKNHRIQVFGDGTIEVSAIGSWESTATEDQE